ncbi:MAG: hypothetical protein HOP28_16940, partial [Gemmatimonadales bacterium]|nr:hypothetical protein [Gemmatimonadales bacterium]
TSDLRIALRPSPGTYGLDLELDTAGAPRSTLVFSYGAHFVAPAGARARYGSDLAFERALGIGMVSAAGMVTFLPTTRPGSDMVSARVAGPGRYLVVAPR